MSSLSLASMYNLKIFNWQEVAEFARPEAVSNEQVFSEVYHALIHSPALETLLNLEHTYALAMGGIVEEKQCDMEHLESRYVKY